MTRLDPPGQDTVSVARQLLMKRLDAHFRAVLKKRLGSKQLASLFIFIDQYAEACERFALEQETGLLKQALDEAEKTIDADLENRCPTCKEFLHVRALHCGHCRANTTHEIFAKQVHSLNESLRKVTQRQVELRQHAELALKTLNRAKRSQKKGPFVRQAVAILEASLAEDARGLSWSALGMVGALAWPLVGHFLKTKKEQPNGPDVAAPAQQPPNPEAAAKVT